MNTKSMALILNGLLLFNTVGHGFSISSWRKKLVNTCVSLGRKSIALVCVMVLVLLSAISLQGALIDRGRKVTRAWNSSHAIQGSQRSFQNPRPFQGSQVMHSDQRPRSAESPAALPGAQHRWALVTAASVPAAGVTAACRGVDPWGFPSMPPNRTEKASQEESEEEISSEDEEIHAFPKELRGSCEKQGDLVVHHPDKPNLLETLPIELVQLITQMIHHKSWVHAGSFQDQWFHQDEVLAKGEEPKEWLDSRKSTSINFIDGDPNKLELALRPSYKRHSAGYTVPTVDAITLDTRTFSQRIEKGKEVDFNYREYPTSYYQKGIISPKGINFCNSSDTVSIPLRRQVNFIDAFNAHMFGWHHDNSPYIDSHGSTTYDGVSYLRASPEERMSLGIQRNLLGERIIWFRAKGNKVGIYEKAMKWYDKSGALVCDGFEPVMKDSEPDGDEFHLVQVVEEPVPVRTISLPHTPVYLKDKDGNEIVGCCTLPPVDSTAHLRSPSDYPQDLDIFALGFSAEETDTRVSFYKQLGDNPAAYNPRLLVNQLSPTTPDPDKIEMLYPNEHPSVMDYFRYADLSAQAYVAIKLGRRQPRATP